MYPTRGEVAHQVFMQLGNYSSHYDVDGIVDEIIATYKGVDLIRLAYYEFWLIAKRHSLDIK